MSCRHDKTWFITPSPELFNTSLTSPDCLGMNLNPWAQQCTSFLFTRTNKDSAEACFHSSANPTLVCVTFNTVNPLLVDSLWFAADLWLWGNREREALHPFFSLLQPVTMWLWGRCVEYHPSLLLPDWLRGRREGHRGLNCAPVFLGDGWGHLNG